MTNAPVPVPDGAQILRLNLPDEAASARLAMVCGQHLAGGDTVLLSGPVGAGKSHFARALIRSHLGPETDVPSPSFTLVQTYQAARFEIWHADLYRLSHTDELAELGLEEAMGNALCLIEWPDRLGSRAPAHPLTIALDYVGDGRSAAITGARKELAQALFLALAQAGSQ